MRSKAQSKNTNEFKKAVNKGDNHRNVDSSQIKDINGTNFVTNLVTICYKINPKNWGLLFTKK